MRPTVRRCGSARRPRARGRRTRPDRAGAAWRRCSRRSARPKVRCPAQITCASTSPPTRSRAGASISVLARAVRHAVFSDGGLPVAPRRAPRELCSRKIPSLKLSSWRWTSAMARASVVDGELDGLAPKPVFAGPDWPDKLAGTLGVILTHVPTSRLSQPGPQRRGQRREAVGDGTFPTDCREVAMQLGVSGRPAGQSVAFSGARGTMRFHDMTVNYLQWPCRQLARSAALRRWLTSARFAFTGGQLKTLKASSRYGDDHGSWCASRDDGGRYRITGPLQDPRHHRHQTDAQCARGRVRSGRISGKADAQLHFKLPLSTTSSSTWSLRRQGDALRCSSPRSRSTACLRWQFHTGPSPCRRASAGRGKFDGFAGDPRRQPLFHQPEPNPAPAIASASRSTNGRARDLAGMPAAPAQRPQSRPNDLYRSAERDARRATLCSI